MTSFSLPREMLAVQIVEFNKPYKIHRIPTPDPSSLKPYEILVKTAAASYCHTDSMVVEGKYPTKLPCIASHEGVGMVVAVGSKVQNFRVRDRVMAGVPMGACGTCESCEGPDDWRQYCPNVEGHFGVFIDGAYAEYFVGDSQVACHIPDGVSFITAAPLACAGCTIYRSLVVTEVAVGEWIGIVGAGGGLGHLGIKMAKALGHNVVAIDTRDVALELCKSVGADHVFDARNGKDENVRQIQAVTPQGQGVAATLNLSEHETAAPLACAITKMHGTVVQVAQPKVVSIPIQEFIFRDIRVKGTLIACRQVSQDMLNLVAKHGIEVNSTLFYGLEQVPKMVELAHSGLLRGKAVCVVDSEQIDRERELGRDR